MNRTLAVLMAILAFSIAVPASAQQGSEQAVYGNDDLERVARSQKEQTPFSPQVSQGAKLLTERMEGADVVMREKTPVAIVTPEPAPPPPPCTQQSTGVFTEGGFLCNNTDAAITVFVDEKPILVLLAHWKVVLSSLPAGKVATTPPPCTQQSTGVFTNGGLLCNNTDINHTVFVDGLPISILLARMNITLSSLPAGQVATAPQTILPTWAIAEGGPGVGSSVGDAFRETGRRLWMALQAIFWIAFIAIVVFAIRRIVGAVAKKLEENQTTNTPPPAYTPIRRQVPTPAPTPRTAPPNVPKPTPPPPKPASTPKPTPTAKPAPASRPSPPVPKAESARTTDSWPPEPDRPPYK